MVDKLLGVPGSHKTALPFVGQLTDLSRVLINSPITFFISDQPTIGPDQDTFKVLLGLKGKGSPYSITERRVPELILVLGSQPGGDVNHKPGGKLSLFSARPAVTPRNP